MKDNNVIRMDARKSKAKVQKTKKHRFSIKKLLLGLIVCIIAAVGIIAGTCKTKKIKIEGLGYYTEAEVRQAVAQNGYNNNSVAYYLKCKIKAPELLPFIDSVKVSLNAPDSITIHVKEKKRAGCLKYGGRYVYFDKKGYALESHDKKYDDVPLVTGLRYNSLKMQHKIKVTEGNEEVFAYLLELTMAIDKYNLPIDQIHIKNDGNTLLISKNITVDLYDRNDLDIKIPELAGMLKKVKGKSGTIDMRYFSEDRKIAISQPKKS